MSNDDVSKKMRIEAILAMPAKNCLKTLEAAEIGAGIRSCILIHEYFFFGTYFRRDARAILVVASFAKRP